MKKITASVMLTLFFLASASMVKAAPSEADKSNEADKTVIAGAKTQAQIQKLLKEGC